jgi:hypothetical protein
VSLQKLERSLAKGRKATAPTAAWVYFKRRRELLRQKDRFC